MKTKPLVSVFIPVYNREKYILEAVKSILKQSFTDFELIIVDDGSTDNTPNLLKSIMDKRIKLFFNEKNMGIPYTRNRGLELAIGKYLVSLDSDDVVPPDMLEKKLSFFNKHHDCTYLGSFEGFIDKNSKLIKRIRTRYTNPDYIHASLCFLYYSVSHSGFMAKTSILKKLKYDENFKVYQDYDLFVRLYLAGYKLYNINEILVFRRMHSGRITNSTWDIAFNTRIETTKKQLQKLNIDFTYEDLKKHVFLRRNHIKKESYKIDFNYLKWAEDWLIKLTDANEKMKVYPDKAFKTLAGKCWETVCTSASEVTRYQAMKCFIRSPLFKYTLLGLSADLSQRYLNGIKCIITLNKIYKLTFNE